MQDFRKIKVWSKAHELVLLVYQATAGFPGEERYGLTSQMRRAAASIPANIVEGRARGSDADFRRFLYIALGSTKELEYLLYLSRDLKFLDSATYDEIASHVDEVGRMLTTFIKKLKANG